MLCVADALSPLIQYRLNCDTIFKSFSLSPSPPYARAIDTKRGIFISLFRAQTFSLSTTCCCRCRYNNAKYYFYKLSFYDADALEHEWGASQSTAISTVITLRPFAAQPTHPTYTYSHGYSHTTLDDRENVLFIFLAGGKSLSL
jgi:hypothetical protein